METHLFRGELTAARRAERTFRPSRPLQWRTFRLPGLVSQSQFVCIQMVLADSLHCNWLTPLRTMSPNFLSGDSHARLRTRKCAVQ